MNNIYLVIKYFLVIITPFITAIIMIVFKLQVGFWKCSHQLLFDIGPPLVIGFLLGFRWPKDMRMFCVILLIIIIPMLGLAILSTAFAMGFDILTLCEKITYATLITPIVGVILGAKLALTKNSSFTRKS